MSTLDTRCPQCSALLRGDAAWCTLCHADLRPPPPEPEPGLEAAPAVIDPLTAPLEQVLAAHEALPPTDLPLPYPGADGIDADAEDAASVEDIDDTDVMFALLRAQTQDPLLAKYGSRFDSKASRVVFVAAAASVLTLVLFGGFTLFGLIFG